MIIACVFGNVFGNLKKKSTCFWQLCAQEHTISVQDGGNGNNEYYKYMQKIKHPPLIGPYVGKKTRLVPYIHTFHNRDKPMTP